MSAPGIQFSSEPHLTYFQPTIQQYLQSIRDAVGSNNLAAARQAYAQLTKTVPVPAQGAGENANELAARVEQGIQALGQALETSDVAAAQQAVAGLRTSMQSMFEEHGRKPPSVAAESGPGNAVSPRDGAVSDGGPNLSVRA